MDDESRMTDGQTEGSSPSLPKRTGSRRLLSGCLVLILSAVVGAAYMLWTVQQVPDFYRQAAAQVADAGQRETAAAQFTSKIESLQAEVKQSAEWTESFSQDEINSWLEHEAENNPAMLPEGVHRPLIVVENGRFQLGVEVNWKDWKGIISLAADVVVTGPRTLEFRLQQVRLGRLVIAMDEVRSRVEPRIEANESDDYRARWIDTPDVAVIEVELIDEDSAHLGLSDIDLSNGRLTIRGVNERPTASDDTDHRP